MRILIFVSLFSFTLLQALQERTQVNQAHPSARGCPPNEGIFFLGDFLYWKGENEAFSNLAFHQTDPFPPTVGTLVQIDFKWEPGTRVGIGWNTPYDGWDVLACWTYFHSHSTGSTNVEPNNNIGLIAFWLVGLPGCLSTEGTWLLNYNMGDGEVSRSFFISQTIALRPFLGIRGGTILQTFEAHYANPASATDNVPGRTYVRNNYWGVGPRFGLKGNWKLGEGFGIFGLFSSSLLYGNLKFQQMMEQRILPAGATTLQSNINNTQSRMIPTLQLIGGISWGTCLKNDKMFLSFEIAWEANYWWNQAQLFPIGLGVGSVPHLFNQPLTLKGLTVGGRLDF